MLENENDLSSVKLIDFGLSAKYDDTPVSTILFNGKRAKPTSTNMLSDKCGTVIFMAPEILFSSGYYKKVDLWSVGILMYMLISGGEHPFYKSKMTMDEY